MLCSKVRSSMGPVEKAAIISVTGVLFAAFLTWLSAKRRDRLDERKLLVENDNNMFERLHTMVSLLSARIDTMEEEARNNRLTVQALREENAALREQTARDAARIAHLEKQNNQMLEHLGAMGVSFSN
jgi:outer membrane murein-binding lipoprotein Lpp